VNSKTVQYLHIFVSFSLANGKMDVIPTALSLTVSFLSAISLLGMPSEIYMHGTMFLYQSKRNRKITISNSHFEYVLLVIA
jgi:hypothetical protein